MVLSKVRAAHVPVLARITGQEAYVAKYTNIMGILSIELPQGQSCCAKRLPVAVNLSDMHFHNV
jgi:hypothetical protein